MYKQFMLLGLLIEQPMYGQQIREVIEEHHDLFANQIKKPTIYYQLERLASEGYLDIRRETVEAPGPGAAHEDIAPRERDVYYITEEGRQLFASLLREMLSTYTPGLSEVDAGIYFLHHLSSADAVALLGERLHQVQLYRDSVQRQVDEGHLSDAAHSLVNEHKMALIHAEIGWLEHSIARLEQNGEPSLPHPAAHSTQPSTGHA